MAIPVISLLPATRWRVTSRLLYPPIPLPIPALEAATKAPCPVWTGSVANPARVFVPLAKKAAVRLWHRARDFDRGTHQPGHMMAPSATRPSRCCTH